MIQTEKYLVIIVFRKFIFTQAKSLQLRDCLWLLIFKKQNFFLFPFAFLSCNHVMELQLFLELPLEKSNKLDLKKKQMENRNHN